MLALGWEHWLCQWRLLCKLEGECGTGAEKYHYSIQFCISVVRKSNGKVIYDYACGYEPGWARWWWRGPATPLVQDELVVCAVQRDGLCPCGQHFGVAESEASCDIPR